MTSRNGYRVGDVVRLARGTNDYTGKIVFLHRTKPMCHVRIEEFDGTFTLWLRDIIRIEHPVVTDKELAALVYLGRWSIAMPAKAMLGVAPGTLAGLAKRGLATGERQGVASSGPMMWKITKEGRRVVT